MSFFEALLVPASKLLSIGDDSIAKTIESEKCDIFAKRDSIPAGAIASSCEIVGMHPRNGNPPLSPPLIAAARPVCARNDSATLAPSGERVFILADQRGKITEK